MHASKTLRLVCIDACISHALQASIRINADITSLSYLDAKPWRQRSFSPFLPGTVGTWFDRFQVPTLQTWESRWSTVNCEGFISQSNTHGFTNTHSLHMGCPEWLHKCTFLPAIYLASCWQQSPISNFIGKAGLYHWPWYMALLVVTQPHSYPWHHCFHRNNITTFSNGGRTTQDSERKQNPNNATGICELLVSMLLKGWLSFSAGEKKKAHTNTKYKFLKLQINGEEMQVG